MSDNQYDDKPRWLFRREFEFVFHFDTPERYSQYEPLWPAFQQRFDELAEEAGAKFQALMVEIAGVTGMTKTHGIDHTAIRDGDQLDERVVVDGTMIDEIVGSSIDKPKN